MRAHGKSKAEVLETYLARVAANDDVVHFHADETSGWDQTAVADLLSVGLLTVGSDVGWIECRQCTKRCVRPVELIPSRSSSSASRAVTTCDLRDDISVVPVDPRRLRRWKSNRASLARFVGQQLGLRVRQADYKVGRIAFQSGRFGQVRRGVSIEFQGTKTMLCVGSGKRRLEEFLLWETKPPLLDRAEVDYWAQELNALGDDHGRHQPSKLKQIQRKNRYAARNEEWQGLAEAMKDADPRRKKSDIADEIFGKQKLKGVQSSKTIERVIRLSKS